MSAQLRTHRSAGPRREGVRVVGIDSFTFIGLAERYLGVGHTLKLISPDIIIPLLLGEVSLHSFVVVTEWIDITRGFWLASRLPLILPLSSIQSPFYQKIKNLKKKRNWPMLKPLSLMIFEENKDYKKFKNLKNGQISINWGCAFSYRSQLRSKSSRGTQA